MKVEKRNVYFCECGKSYLTKRACELHEQNCSSFKHPKNKSCKTCAFGCYETGTPPDRETGDPGEYPFWNCENPKAQDVPYNAGKKRDGTGEDYIVKDCTFHRLTLPKGER